MPVSNQSYGPWAVLLDDLLEQNGWHSTVVPHKRLQPKEGNQSIIGPQMLSSNLRFIVSLGALGALGALGGSVLSGLSEWLGACWSCGWLIAV